MNDQMLLSQARDFLRQNKLATLATLSADSQTPQAALLYYAVMPNMKLGFATAKDSRKLNNIVKNKSVALLVGNEAESKVIQIEGEAEIVSDPNEKSAIIRKISDIANDNTNFTFPPLMELVKNSSVALFSVKIVFFKYSDFSQGRHQLIEGSGEDLLNA
jgi:general stress protein 26